MCIAIPVSHSSSSKPSQPDDLPGDLAIWLFIYAELLVFGVFFITYMVVRGQNIELFNESQLQLNKTLGMINTLVLITSSYFVVKCVNAIKRDEQERSIVWLFVAIIMGMVFVLSKTHEFSGLFGQGIGLGYNKFYTYYIAMTFFHYMHVILGLLILVFILIKSFRHGYTMSDYSGMETGAVYWHMVDLVWIVLFPLVYLIS